MRTISISITVFLLLHHFAISGQDTPQFAAMGDFPLENGQVIKNCRLGFYTFGKLNPDKSNVVVLLPWYSGKSTDFIFAVGPNGLADSSLYHVVIIDPLGDGVSSSPSNSSEQPNSRFPEFSIRDMVNVQHKFLNEKLGIRHVRAIAGFSMGGMECFQWAVSYPGFMEKIIPISGSAKPTPYVRLFYKTIITAAEAGMHDTLDARKAGETIGLLFALHVYSTDFIQRLTSDSLLNGYITDWASGFSTGNLYNLAYQMKAIFRHNVFAGLEKGEEEVIKNIRAQMLIVINSHDRDVHPQSNYAFAKKPNAELMELTSEFGHMSFFIEFKTIAGRVREFLTP